jgi:hypothetical protein
MTGSVRAAETPGLFILTANVDVSGNTQPMDFAFTADKPVTVGFPDLTDMAPRSKIIQ